MALGEGTQTGRLRLSIVLSIPFTEWLQDWRENDPVLTREYFDPLKCVW